MLKREKIDEQVSVKMNYLSDSVDAALLGYVERGGRNKYILPCYGYQAIKAILRASGASGPVMYAKIQALFSKKYSSELPVILVKMNHTELWRTINAKKYPRWEGLDSAIIGLGKIGPHEPTGIVYNKPGCINCLTVNSSDGSDGSNAILNAIRMMDENITPVTLGQYTPWYLTPVK